MGKLMLMFKGKVLFSVTEKIIVKVNGVMFFAKSIISQILLLYPGIQANPPPPPRPSRPRTLIHDMINVISACRAAGAGPFYSPRRHRTCGN